jgi:hypothetical protein
VGHSIVGHRTLADVDIIYNSLPTFFCGVVEHRKLAGVDYLYTARAAIQQPAPAGCW